MQGTVFVFLALLIPAVAVPVMLLTKNNAARKIFVSVFSAAMILNAVMIAVDVLKSGPLKIASENAPWAGIVVTAVDVVTLIAILYFGVRLKEWKIIVPSIFQAAALFYLEVIRKAPEPEYIINIDNLGLVMLLLSSVLGSLVAIFALGYMEKHERHKKNSKDRQHIFFAVIFLFLCAMNAISISDNVMHLYAFWEITTLCSFLLIGYDRNRNALVSAKRALWLNSVGGLFFAAGIVLISIYAGTYSISKLVSIGGPGSMAVMGIMFICCAGFVKSAQLPFQSWLLGAMVAPTPVSALLHSSTMVKAGVYVIVRFSPIFGGKMTGGLVALVGGFTFMAASAIAISQSNGKRVLAYSTIANLGLIITCAGLGGAEALSAAILLIIYHAVSKGLLFLCMGTVEQEIGSRNIEDMYGIFPRMPFTTSIMALGMISMMLPPFGVLITKWMALEAAVRFPIVLIMIVLGSAFTIVFWVKWLGAVLTVSGTHKSKMENLPFSIKFSLGLIGLFIPVLTALIALVNDYIVNPAVSQILNLSSHVRGNPGGLLIYDSTGRLVTGGFSGVPALLLILLIAFVSLFIFTRFNRPKIVTPYACGERADQKGKEFIGPMDKVERIKIHNYYLTGLFSEQKLTPVCSFISILLILIMFGVS